MSTFPSMSFEGSMPSSNALPNQDPHAVLEYEATQYYNGIHSSPRLIYCTIKEQFFPSPPQEHKCMKKELSTVFDGQFANLWNDGLWMDIVKIMRTHSVVFSTIDIFWFKITEDPLPWEDNNSPNANKLLQAGGG
ncbi:hypothetical protein B0J17DRAFT_720617 [Rhizoctonia solani]|nr:hypothetical protein B0J17DRAFT_720617 [Rhizoctonia solani]